ncbi:ATP-binding protein [Cohaesibacter sp. CAU 1516]|uniref:ATP-binding protein n=1 Tax=Cohaesibacter sp. CAU 1516 TaxID=2576038 RepID=UPI0014853C34|nr:ATP-binding protein [Cohaesibacter sp. CAU 1516]
MIGRFLSRLKSWLLHGLLVAAIFLMVSNPFLTDVQNKIGASELLLNMYRTSLETEVARYKFLPFILSQNDRILEILSDRFDPVESGYFLQRTKYATNVSAIYVLDRTGKVTAASNWHREDSYVGRNLGFRPYFKDAMAGRLGQFYGVGLSSTTPGFFLSYGLRKDEDIIGVIAVEVNLSELEKVWRSGPDDILVSDVDGTIFLSSNESWKHKTFGQVGSSTVGLLDRSIPPAHTTHNPIARKRCYRLGSITVYKDPNYACLFPATFSLQEEIVEFGWTIHSIQPARPIYQSLLLVAIITLLIYLSVVFLYRNIRNKYKRSIQKLRTQLTENSKLAAIGQMATEVAHDFNQPLSAIYMLLDTSRLLLERKMYKDVDDNLMLVSSHIERLKQQISQLKSFASRHRVPRGHANIVEAAHSSLHLFQLTLKKQDVQLQFHTTQADIEVPCNEIGLGQIFSNLITNAIEAMADQSKKRITISIARKDQKVIVKLRDNGPGIPDPSKIYESFYTTKKSGTGLGLAIVKGILENSEGSITVGNHPEGGAEFTLTWTEWKDETRKGNSAEDDRALEELFPKHI